MSIGPVEVLFLAFPGNQFNGEILPELERLVGERFVAVIDGLVVRKDADGVITFAEFEELEESDDASRFTGLLQQVDALISEDDIAELAAGLEPNSTGAVLIFEHTWATAFRDAVVDSGGSMVANFRVPTPVVEELIDELAAID